MSQTIAHLLQSDKIEDYIEAAKTASDQDFAMALEYLYESRKAKMPRFSYDITLMIFSINDIELFVHLDPDAEAKWRILRFDDEPDLEFCHTAAEATKYLKKAFLSLCHPKP